MSQYRKERHHMFLKSKENTQPWKNPRLALKQHHSSTLYRAALHLFWKELASLPFTGNRASIEAHREPQRNHRPGSTQSSCNMPRSLRWEKQESAAQLHHSLHRSQRKAWGRWGINKMRLGLIGTIYFSTKQCWKKIHSAFSAAPITGYKLQQPRQP